MVISIFLPTTQKSDIQFLIKDAGAVIPAAPTYAQLKSIRRRDHPLLTCIRTRLFKKLEDVSGAWLIAAGAMLERRLSTKANHLICAPDLAQHPYALRVAFKPAEHITRQRLHYRWYLLSLVGCIF
jgi:hypothetical protein